MNRTTEEIFRLRIQSRKDTMFQSFIERLYVTCYGKNFVPIKQKRDKGCDGILNGKTIIAVYAPEKHSLKNFKTKILNETSGNLGDFNKYKKYWQEKYPGWQIVYNGEFTAEMVQFVHSLKNDVELLGLQHILELIRNQYWGHIRQLADYLDIEEEYLINDIFDEIIQDLLKGRRRTKKNIKYKPPKYIEEKIPLNFSGKDIETAKTDYREALKHFHNLNSILKNQYDDDDLDVLKNRVRDDIDKYSGTFKEKFNNLITEYSKKYTHDDEYKRFVKTLLIYLFEQCILGKKTEWEDKNDSSTS